MANCLRTDIYDESIAEGQLYVYRLLKPQRCSLAIAPTDDGTWRLEQAVTKDNQMAPAVCLTRVRSWLENQRGRGTTWLMQGGERV